MADARYCTSGQNSSGNWFVACKETVASSLSILRDMMFDENLSPADQPYDLAARHVREHGGVFWATNAKGEYTTIAGIPEHARNSAE